MRAEAGRNLSGKTPAGASLLAGAVLRIRAFDAAARADRDGNATKGRQMGRAKCAGSFAAVVTAARGGRGHALRGLRGACYGHRDGPSDVPAPAAT